MNLEARLEQAKKDAIEKALDALGRYKFEMFGYWASKWVSFNQLSETKDPNPFRELVKTSRSMRGRICSDVSCSCDLGVELDE